MSVNKTYFVDIFDEMIQNIQAIYDAEADTPEKPYGMYGRRQEICELLTEKDESSTYKFKKYPLIILYHSQTEKRGTEGNTEFIVSPLMSIVMDSRRDLRTGTRIEGNVKTYLMPIYNLLMNEICDNPVFFASYLHEIEHDFKIWDGSPADSKEAGIMFNDYLDGIDIVFKNLKIFKQQPSYETINT